MKERTITIQGKEVALLYCAATENGFEDLCNKGIRELNFNSQKELIMLGLCAIVAAYSRRGEEPPITSDTLLYHSTPQELSELIRVTLELSQEWYGIPKVVADTLEKEQQDIDPEEQPKN